MKLEQQVCSLELAKKLRELGVKQESLFYWSDTYAPFLDYKSYITEVNGVPIPRLSAFTVAELGQELIIGTDTMWDGQKFQVTFGDHERAWSVREETEADARAKMLIYLLENNLIPKGEAS